MDIDLEECLETAISLAREAGQIVNEGFYLDKTVTTKGEPANLVTEFDTRVQRILFDRLGEKFPTHKLIGEESVSEPVLTDAPTWIIDPIDGTTNFIHGFPLTCISIGLTVNREPVLGVVYNPILEHMFTARKGHGAFLNSRRIHVSDVTGRERAFLNSRRIHVSNVTGRERAFLNSRRIHVSDVAGRERAFLDSRRIHVSDATGRERAFLNSRRIYVSDVTDMSKALVGLEVPTTQRPSTFEMRVKRGRAIEQVAREIRGLGSIVIGLCFVAMGGLDVYQYEGGIHCWDVAAASVILLEAGGVITDPRGGPFDLMSKRVLGAGTEKLALQMVKIIQEADSS
uniref:Inositol-1-monophosphatase n=2 Tax=Timema TaxID=61471 RepID=A0A7R9JE38_TIMCA|nr:unnamed protein product [Timema californicum]